MKIARVTGNLVSTIKQDMLYGKPLKTVVFVDAAFGTRSEEYIAVDVAGCTAGDIVLVNTECDAAVTMFGDEQLVCEMTICGIIDEITVEGTVLTAKDIGKSG